MKIYTKEEIENRQKKRKTRLKILRRIFYPIVILIIVFCAYVAYQKLIKHEQNVSIFGYKGYIVLTGSMQPNLNIGDLVIDKTVKEEELKVGDVITFTLKNSNVTVTHRIVEIVEQDGKKYYKTKGDNNNTEDIDLISYENIEGLQFLKIGKVGTIITKLLTGTGLIVMIVIIVISYERSNRKEDRTLAREDARKKYNVCKYKKDEEDKK